MLLMSYVTLSNASATSSAQFLKMGAGARAAGMADAFSAVADDVTAGYWNPAGLQQISSPEMSVMQNNSLVETQYQYAGAALPMGPSTATALPTRKTVLSRRAPWREASR